MKYETEQLMNALDYVQEGDYESALNILDDCDHESADKIAELLRSDDTADHYEAEWALTREIDSDDSAYD